MISKLGILSIIAGLVLGLFTLLSNFMGAAAFLSTMTISTFFQSITGKILDWISNDAVYNVLYSLFYEIPFAGVLTGLGVILLITGTFIRKD